jgi:hypothetical protein
MSPAPGHDRAVAVQPAGVEKLRFFGLTGVVPLLVNVTVAVAGCPAVNRATPDRSRVVLGTSSPAEDEDAPGCSGVNS